MNQDPSAAASGIDLAIGRGLAYLEDNVDSDVGFQSRISRTEDMSEVIDDPSAFFPDRSEMPLELFTSALILDLVYRRRPNHRVARGLVELLHRRRRLDGHFDFFFDHGLLPTDVDCTSIGLSVLVAMNGCDDAGLDRAIERVVGNVSDEGVIEVYLPPVGTRRYVDPTVCVNALHLLYLVGADARAGATAEAVERVLTTRDFTEGTRYYPSPDAFLFFAGRMVETGASARQRFGASLRQAVSERRCASRVPLEVAMRVAAGCAVGLRADDEVDWLVESQQADGSWPPYALYRFGRRHGFFGSEALVTAFAIAALDAVAGGQAR